MKDRNAYLVSALVYLGAVLAVARLARMSSTPAHVLAAVLMAGGIVVSAALTPRGPYRRRALVAAAIVLAASMTLPLALVDDPAAWLRKTPSILGYLWVWMMILGLSSPSTARRWCGSTVALLVASALLGGGVVLSALW